MKKLLYTTLLVVFTLVITALIIFALMKLGHLNLHHFVFNFRKSLLGDPSYGIMLLVIVPFILLYISALIAESLLLYPIFKFRINYIAKEKVDLLVNKLLNAAIFITSAFLIISIFWADIFDYIFSLIYILIAVWMVLKSKNYNLNKEGFKLIYLAGMLSMAANLDKVIAYPEHKMWELYWANFILWAFVLCLSFRMLFENKARNFVLLSWIILFFPIFEFMPSATRQVVGKVLLKTDNLYFTKFTTDRIYAIDSGPLSTHVSVFKLQDGKYFLEQEQIRQYGGGSMTPQVFRNGK